MNGEQEGNRKEVELRHYPDGQIVNRKCALLALAALILYTALYGRWKRKFVNTSVRCYVLWDVKTCTVQAGVPTFRRNRLLPAPCTLNYEGGIFRPDNNSVPHYK